MVVKHSKCDRILWNKTSYFWINFCVASDTLKRLIEIFSKHINSEPLGNIYLGRPSIVIWIAAVKLIFWDTVK